MGSENKNKHAASSSTLCFCTTCTRTKGIVSGISFDSVAVQRDSVSSVLGTQKSESLASLTCSQQCGLSSAVKTAGIDTLKTAVSDELVGRRLSSTSPCYTSYTVSKENISDVENENSCRPAGRKTANLVIEKTWRIGRGEDVHYGFNEEQRIKSIELYVGEASFECLGMNMGLPRPDAYVTVTLMDSMPCPHDYLCDGVFTPNRNLTSVTMKVSGELAWRTFTFPQTVVMPANTQFWIALDYLTSLRSARSILKE